jgi:hypothetical protein
MKKKASIAYIAIIGVVFAAFVIVFDTFPRSKVSELEKRELAQFPTFTKDSLLDGSFTREVSQWFSDSEPYRDELMTLSMDVKDHIRLTTNDEEQITFHAAEPEQGSTTAEEDNKRIAELDEAEKERADGIVPEEIADENAKIANAGIVIVGKGEKVRALMAFGGSASGCVGYANSANKYKETFPNVNIYCMVIPTSMEFYCPEKVKKHTKPQRPVIDNVINHLAPGVKSVDVYYTLKEHAQEDIYLRTDHHWAPLGAFYAAKKFAQVAGVPFRDLNSYERHVVHGYVGSMYGYSKDISVKKAPEDFVYYVPTGVSYETTYTNYNVDKSYHVTGVGKPYTGPFFYKFKDGSGGAYCTFMGGDMKLTQVRTSTKNGRRLIILKDSFGNALPGYLFYSFEEVHVIDSRYFKKNMIDYVRENHITDILFANNIFKAYSNYTYSNYVKFLTQNGGGSATKDAANESTEGHTKAKPDSTSATKDVTKPEGEKPKTEEKNAHNEDTKPAGKESEKPAAKEKSDDAHTGQESAE